MKKVFLFFLFAMATICTVSAQSAGDMIVSGGSQLSGQRVADLSLNGTIGYQISDAVQVGLSIQNQYTDNQDIDWYQAYVKRYFNALDTKNNRGFVQIMAGISTTPADYNQTSLGVGWTCNVSKWFFLEPLFSVQYTNSDSNDSWNIGIGVSCGMKF